MATPTKPAALRAVTGWLDEVFGDLARQLRWSFLPPLMVYFAAGISGLTAIVGVFFVKDYLGLPAAFLAGLGFWAGLPWALKLPLGHLVDILWRWKGLLVVAGAASFRSHERIVPASSLSNEATLRRAAVIPRPNPLWK